MDVRWWEVMYHIKHLENERTVDLPLSFLYAEKEVQNRLYYQEKSKKGLLKNGQLDIMKINYIGQKEGFMNEKILQSAEEKQQAIINAGFRIFSQNSYKKSPMQKVADAAGISKSLLFHYFHNKKDFYMFLLKAKIHIMKKYPFMEVL